MSLSTLRSVSSAKHKFKVLGSLVTKDDLKLHVKHIPSREAVLKAMIAKIDDLEETDSSKQKDRLRPAARFVEEQLRPIYTEKTKIPILSKNRLIDSLVDFYKEYAGLASSKDTDQKFIEFKASLKTAFKCWTKDALEKMQKKQKTLAMRRHSLQEFKKTSYFSKISLKAKIRGIWVALISSLLLLSRREPSQQSKN